MHTSSDRHVDIVEQGRSGSVVYRQTEGSLRFHWEFGGGDVVAIVQAGDEASWWDHRWAIGRRTEILRFVADEVIRQKAPNCRAEINERSGDILLRQVGPPPPPPTAPDVAFVRRLSRLKMMLGLVVLVVALIFGGVMWLKNKVLVIDPGKGTPVGYAVRTDHHVAVLIQTLEAYTPSLNRDHGKDTYSISLFIVPLDGTEPRMVPIKGGLSPNSYSLAKVLGSDGRAIWFDAAGTGAVDLETYELLRPSELREPPEPKRTSALPFGPQVEHHLAAGFFTSPASWLGLHSAAEAERDFKPGSWVKRVVRAESAKQQRRLYSGVVDADPTAGRHRIASMQQLSDAEYLNAAFVRMDDMSEPFLFNDPPGALMVFTSDPGLNGTLMVARVDLEGNVLWKTDTGIDRFLLQQILPGEGSTVFVGTRPPVPDNVSEPLLVIVDATGTMRSVSLWQ